MKKIKFFPVIYIYFLILGILFLLTNSSIAQNQDLLKILEDIGYYYPAYGYYAVYGILQNQGSKAVCNVTITATFFDAKQEEVDIVNGTTLLNVILPGRKSPILIYQFGNLTAQKIESYHLEIASFEIFTEQKPYGLDLVSVVYYGGVVPGQGPSEHPQYLGVVQGDVVNIGNLITNYVTVGVVIYDENGIVAAGTSDPITSAKGLLPRKSEQFHAYISLPLEQAPKIKSYMLVAESPEYVSKDEIIKELSTDDQNQNDSTTIPFFIGILLAIILLVIIYRTKRSKHARRKSEMIKRKRRMRKYLKN